MRERKLRSTAEPPIDVSEYRDAAIKNFEAEVQAFLEKHKEDWLIIEKYQEYYPTAQQAEFGRPYELLYPAEIHDRSVVPFAQPASPPCEKFGADGNCELNPL